MGLRPGEKLFEEINCKGEAYRPTQHPRIMRFVTGAEDWRKINGALERMSRELHRAEPDRLKQLIQQSVPEYTPDLRVKAKPAVERMPFVRSGSRVRPIQQEMTERTGVDSSF